MYRLLIEELRGLVREHNQQHDKDFKICFQDDSHSVTLWPAFGDVLFYGEVLAKFVSEYDLEMMIFPDKKHIFQIVIR